MRAGLAALAAGLLGGVVCAEYVDAALFSVVTPALVGVACGAAAMAAARPAPGTRAYQQVRYAAVAAALLGTAYGFRLVPGVGDPFGPAGKVVPPYLAAAAGAWLWTLPPRRRAPRTDGEAEPRPDPAQPSRR